MFVEIDLPTEPLVDAARSVFGNVNVAFAGFVCEPAACKPYWFLEHTLEGTRLDLGQLLRSRGFTLARPTLARGVSADRMSGFSEIDPLSLVPSLAGALAAGGADGLRLPITRAHELATSFVNGWIGERAGDVVTLHSRVCWSDWFACDVWDQTWIIAERDGSAVTLLCVTGGHRPGNF